MPYAPGVSSLIYALACTSPNITHAVGVEEQAVAKIDFRAS